MAGEEMVAASLRGGVARLRNAADVAAVQSILDDAAAGVLGAGHRRLLPTLEPHYAQFLDRLIGHVLPDWVPCMPSWQRYSCFDVWFDGSRIPHHIVLLALGRAMSGSAASSACVQLVHTLFWGCDKVSARHSAGLAQILSWASTELTAAAEDQLQAGVETVLALLCSLPDRIANVLRGQCPDWAQPPTYHATLAESMWALLNSTVGPSGHGKVLTSLLEKQARCHRAAILLRVWTPRLLDAAKQNLAVPPVVVGFRSVLERLTEPTFEYIVRALLAALPPFCASHVRPQYLLRELFAPGLRSRLPWRYLISQKLPIDQQLHRQTTGKDSVRYVLDCLFESDACAASTGRDADVSLVSAPSCRPTSAQVHSDTVAVTGRRRGRCCGFGLVRSGLCRP